MWDNIFTQKRDTAKLIKWNYKFISKNKPTGLIILNNINSIDFLLDGLEVLSCDFVVKSEKKLKEKLNIAYDNSIKKDLISWFDFVITDNDLEWLRDYFSNGITPIVPENNYLSTLLKEFDPMKNEWNSFLYKDWNTWSMYAAIVRYLENYKFPMDNRNLVKNICNL